MDDDRQLYVAFGRVLSGPSGLSLAGAPDDAAVQLEMNRDESLREAADPEEAEWDHQIEDFPGGPVMRLRRADGTFVIDYDCRTFVLEPARGRIRYARGAEDTDHAFSLALIVERVLLPLYILFERQTALGLHGSAVAIDGRAYVFIGRSGAGKSTSAYELTRRGATLIADDMTVVDVEDRVALAASPTLRLWKEEGAVPEALEDRRVWQKTTKRWFRLDESHGCIGPIPLGAIILLDPDHPEAAGEPRIESPSAREALVGLLEQTFDFTNPWRDWQIRRFRLAAQLVNEAPVLRFMYTKSPDGRPTHVEPLLRAIEQLDAPSTHESP